VLALENRNQVDELVNGVPWHINLKWATMHLNAFVLGRIQNEAEQLRMKNSTLAGSGWRSGFNR
jgi:hypothetical protein